jgi:hypothetical protein
MKGSPCDSCATEYSAWLQNPVEFAKYEKRIIEVLQNGYENHISSCLRTDPWTAIPLHHGIGVHASAKRLR